MRLKKVLALVLAVAMVLGAMGTTTFAETNYVTASEVFPAADADGVITLTGDITLPIDTRFSEEMEINLNGYTLYLTTSVTFNASTTIYGGTINADNVSCPDGIIRADYHHDGEPAVTLTLEDVTVSAKNVVYGTGVFYVEDENDTLILNNVDVTAVGANSDPGSGVFYSASSFSRAKVVLAEGTTVKSDYSSAIFFANNVDLDGATIECSNVRRPVFRQASGTVANSTITVESINDGQALVADVSGNNSGVVSFVNSTVTAPEGTPATDFSNEGSAALADEDSTIGDNAGVDYLPKELDGEGTQASPYLINDLADLKAFRNNVNNGETYQDKYIQLTADIDLANEEWEPIGNASNKFQGYFDGNEKTISNLLVSGSNDYAGFFGYILGKGMSASAEASVKNLTLDGVSVSGYNRVGAVAGQGYVCKIENVTVKGDVSGNRYVGGLVGHVYVYFDNCHFVGDVTGTFDAIGGMAGAGDGRFYGCSVIGDVTGSNWVGGLIANGQEGTSAVGCYVKGTVSTSNNYYYGVGGIAGVGGHGYNGSVFKDNYFDGEVYMAGEKVNAIVVGIINANSNDTIGTTVEGNSWNTEYYSAKTPVVVTADVTNNMTAEEWAASASDKSSVRNNNLVMLESDLFYVDAADADDVTIMEFSSVTEAEVATAVVENKFKAYVDTNKNGAYDAGEVKYEDIQEAIVAAAPAGTVELLRDVTVDVWNMMSQTKTIANGKIITVNMDGLTIDGNGFTLTVNDVESAGNGGSLFDNAANLNIYDLTIDMAQANVGGIGLESGVIEGVTFNNGSAIFPGNGEILVNDCTFNTNGHCIYYEVAKPNLTVTESTFNVAAENNVIIMRGGETFSNNVINSGRTVNVAAGSPVVDGNVFNNDVRFKVYNTATAVITNNTITNLVFNDATPFTSVFAGNTLSADAQAKLDELGAVSVARIGDAYFKTLAEAFAAAKKGDVIELMSNVTVTDQIKITDNNVLSDITLDGNDFTISAGNLTENKSVLYFGDNSLGAYATGVKIKDVTIDADYARFGMFFCGGHKSELTNVTLTGDYHYYGVNLYGTAGADMTNCDLVSVFTNGQDDNPLNLVNTKIGTLYANKSDLAVDQTKVFIDANSYVDKLIVWGTKTHMIDSLENVGSVETADGKSMVAQAGKIQYTTLQEAIDAAADGAVVSVLSDIELTETVTVAADKNITIDLNGKTVSMNRTDKVTKNHTMISNSGNLTIMDSANGGKLSYIYSGDNIGTTYSVNTVTSNPGSTLTVKSGIIENLTFDSSVIAYAIDGLTNGGMGDVTINIEGGIITSERQSIRIFENSTTNTGTLNISGGDITGRVIIQNANANANKAAMNISGGTFNTNAYKTEVLYVGGSNGATMDVTAGLSISDGIFNGDVYSNVGVTFISGGLFSNDVSDYLLEDLEAAQNADGSYSIVPERSITIVADKAAVVADEEVTISVIMNGENMQNIDFELTYDPAKFELQGADNTGKIVGRFFKTDGSVYENGKAFATYTFKAIAQSEDTTADFIIDKTFAYTEIESLDGTKVATANNTKVTVAINAIIVETVDDYVDGKTLVLVYTNAEDVFFKYDGKMMVDVTARGYLYEDAKAYDHVFGFVTDGKKADGTAITHDEHVAEVTHLFSDAGLYKILAYNADLNFDNEKDLRDITTAYSVYNVSAAAFGNLKYQKNILKSDIIANKHVDGYDTGAVVNRILYPDQYPDNN